MIKILKKQWFVVLIALIFIGFAIFSVYDTNKGKLPGKSVDGKDVVAGLKGDVNITADELYKNLSKTYGKSMLFMKFQAEVINSSIKTTDELKKTAEEYESNIKQSAESQAASSGSDANALIAQNIAQYGFTSDQLYEYCMTVAKMEKMQNDYISKHLDELFTPIYKEKKSRTVSHILIKMEDANKPTKKELEKIQKVEDALKKGDSFADVAKKYSDDGSASDGGYLGYMDSDTSYVDSFKNAAFKLKAGETSDWVKESNDNYNGWHLIKVEETDKAKLEKDKKAKDSLYKAIASGTENLSNTYLWEAAKKLDIKYANDDVKKQIMDILDVTE